MAIVELRLIHSHRNQTNPPKTQNACLNTIPIKHTPTQTRKPQEKMSIIFNWGFRLVGIPARNNICISD